MEEFLKQGLKNEASYIKKFNRRLRNTNFADKTSYDILMRRFIDDQRNGVLTDPIVGDYLYNILKEHCNDAIEHQRYRGKNGKKQSNQKKKKA